jgi:hypothetical protein
VTVRDRGLEFRKRLRGSRHHAGGSWRSSNALCGAALAAHSPVTSKLVAARGESVWYFGQYDVKKKSLNQPNL